MMMLLEASATTLGAEAAWQLYVPLGASIHFCFCYENVDPKSLACFVDELDIWEIGVT